MQDSTKFQQRLLLAIMTGLLLWGVVHAVGAVRLNENPWRGVVVLACCAGFIGAWLLLLQARSRRSGE